MSRGESCSSYNVVNNNEEGNIPVSLNEFLKDHEVQKGKTYQITCFPLF
jgi:hypothetical protein